MGGEELVVCEVCGRPYGQQNGSTMPPPAAADHGAAATLTGWIRVAPGRWQCGLDDQA